MTQSPLSCVLCAFPVREKHTRTTTYLSVDLLCSQQLYTKHAMAISKDSSTAAVDDTPKTQFCRRGRPTYFLVRPNNGSIVPLIPADQIGSGYRFANLPYSIDVTATVGMTNLGVVANDGGVFEIEEAAQQQSAGSTSDAEHNVRYNHMHKFLCHLLTSSQK